MRFRAIAITFALGAVLLLSGCATPRSPAAAGDASITTQNVAPKDAWAGRIGLQIQSEPPQAFFAGFELKGNAQAGELKLTSPIGSVLGVMRWTPSEAVLESGRDTRKFASVDALLEQTTGAAIPVNALFDWLNGKNTSLNGWTADLSQQPDGKITARRTSPAPQTDLRVVLE
ncbi:MAG: lipoprotein insertase outer membrane protein LolB [Pseudomonadota bacterium]